MIRRCLAWAWRQAGRAQVALAVTTIVAIGGFLRVEDEIDDRQAQDCIDDWQLVDELRDVVPTSIEAIIENVPDARPELVDAVRRSNERLMAERLTDPDCDLDSALDRVGR